MNKRQAEKEGLAYTGIYCRHDEAKQRASELRKQGFRAIVINDDGNYRSSVYASPEYFEERNKQYNKQIFDGIPTTIESIQKEYQQKIEKLENLRKELKEKYNF